MTNEERQYEIIELLRAQRKRIITVKQICQKCYISESSARRDLKKLEEEGLIKRIHGGAKLIERDIYEPQQTEEKNNNIYEKIAAEAAQYLNNCNIIFFDSGIITSYLIPFVANMNNLLVVTNNLDHIVKLSIYPKISVISIGGFINPKTLSTYGEYAFRFVDNFNADAVFVTCNSFDAQAGASEINTFEAELKKKYISRSKKIIILCDSSNINKTSPFVICEPKKIDALITDSKLSPVEADKLIKHKIPFRCI